MKRLNWQILLGATLVVLSVAFYFFHYTVFHDAHHIFIYLVGDIAFVPIEVLLVTLIIHRVLSHREKRIRLEKLNMVIGTFFSQVGTKLLTYYSDFDPRLDTIRRDLLVASDWTDEQFQSLSKVSLEHLKDFLTDHRDFLVRLLENPSLLEHESFTNLLRAVFHLTEELEGRDDVRHLPASDYTHLAGDIKRSYILLVREWVDYMQYLKHSYPYLFSLAMRLNPFDLEASPVVK
jgi:hypothetical protein